MYWKLLNSSTFIHQTWSLTPWGWIRGMASHWPDVDSAVYPWNDKLGFKGCRAVMGHHQPSSHWMDCGAQCVPGERILHALVNIQNLFKLNWHLKVKHPSTLPVSPTQKQRHLCCAMRNSLKVSLSFMWKLALVVDAKNGCIVGGNLCWNVET